MSVSPTIFERTFTQGANVEVEVLRGNAFTEEAGAHVFRIHGQNAAGETIALSGTVLAKCLRSDNWTIDISGEISDGVAEVTLVGDCYHVPGRLSVVIYISDGTDTVAIYAAIADVYRATSGQELDSGTTVPSLAQLEAAYQDCLDATAAAEEILGTVATVAEVKTYLNIT